LLGELASGQVQQFLQSIASHAWLAAVMVEAQVGWELVTGAWAQQLAFEVKPDMKNPFLIIRQ